MHKNGTAWRVLILIEMAVALFCMALPALAHGCIITDNPCD
jgi:hypothetical protein